jgi:DNA helicase HerA-like ATPase
VQVYEEAGNTKQQSHSVRTSSSQRGERAMASPSPAVSHDGRTFSFTPEPGRRPAPGDIVLLDVAGPGSTVYVGQVIGADGPGRDEWHGVLIGTLGENGTMPSTDCGAFAAAVVESADTAVLEALQEARRAGLTIGTWTAGDVTVPARLIAQGFSRHTFLCGQSGSGKTYALGVILEQVLLETGLRTVVLDPNADFVHLDRTREGVAEATSARWRDLDVRVLGTGAGHDPLRLRFATMPHAAQAAVLQLDPLADRREYNLFLQRAAAAATAPLGDIVSRLRDRGDAEQALADRVENLGLLDWDVWAYDDRSAAEVVAEHPDLTVVDLSGFGDQREAVAVCLDLVESLWATRGQRIPTLLVIDEAHNICPSEPNGPAQTALVSRLVQIAAEGRKYGLWLLLSTQRPSKIHAQVLSQCDNLVLMRMNSRSDTAQLVEAFGFVPPLLAAGAQQFRQGEALVAGALVPVPSAIRMGDRLTPEGGGDVSVPLASHK